MKSPNSDRSNHRSRTEPYPLATLATLLLIAGPVAGQAAEAAPEPSTPAAQTEKPAPLPPHQIEGNGGIFSPLSAYIVNPPRDGEVIGRPSLGFAYVSLGHDQDLEALTATVSPWKRLELGYGWNRLGLGDLPLAIKEATTVGISREEVQVHNVNARLQLLKEGEFDQKWIPAVTFGTHFKHNDGIGQIDRDLGGALTGVGIEDNNGADFTLYASKLFTQLPRPVLVELGGRATKGVWNGLGGFTDDYSFLFEGNVVVFVTSNLALAAEYKQQANDYTPIIGPGGPLVGKSGDWWTLDAAYVVNKHFTVAAGYGHFGGVLNHQANGVWGITTKYEF